MKNYVLENPPLPFSFVGSNKVGAVSGCSGAPNKVEGAASNPGYKYMSGGSGSTYYGYTKSGAPDAAIVAGGHAPVSAGKHNQCGGKRSKRRTRHHKRRTRHHKRRSRHHKRSHKRSRTARKGQRKSRRPRRTKRQRGGYSQYLTNVPYAHGLSTGGSLSPSDNALATPPPYKAYNHCHDNYNHMSSKK